MTVLNITHYAIRDL